MKRLLIYLFLVVSIAVYAQKQAEDANEDAGSEKPVIEQPDTSGDDGTPESQDASSTAAEGSEDVDEQSTELPGGTSADQPDGGELEPENESVPSEEDFEPDEEISEDYPVPLPSDI